MTKEKKTKNLTQILINPKHTGLLEHSYHGTNPFHNATHAADVAQAMHCFMYQDELMAKLTKLELLGAIIAAVGHDGTFLSAYRNILRLYYIKNFIQKTQSIIQE